MSFSGCQAFLLFLSLFVLFFFFFFLQRDKSLVKVIRVAEDFGLPLMQCSPGRPQICPSRGEQGMETQDLFPHSSSIIYLFHSGPHRIRVNSHIGIDHHCNLERTCHRFYKDSQNMVSVKLKKKYFARCLISEFDRKTPKCLNVWFDIQRIF